MLEYTRKFIETCFDYEDQQKLFLALGGALYHDESVMGKIFVLSGTAGSGKSSVIFPFYKFLTKNYRTLDQSIIVIDDIDITKIEDRYGFNKNKKQVIFATTNRFEVGEYDNVEIIRTTGKRLNPNDYKKFAWEMEYFGDEFFRKCMIEFALRKKYDDI